jgi:hypothetical protein
MTKICQDVASILSQSLPHTIRAYPTLSGPTPHYQSLPHTLRAYPTLSEPIPHSQSLSHTLRAYPTLSESIPHSQSLSPDSQRREKVTFAASCARSRAGSEVSGDGGRRGPAAAPQPRPRLRRSPRSASCAPTCGLHCRRCSRRPVGRQQALPRYPLPRLSIDYTTGSRSRSVTHPHHVMTRFRTTVQ